MVVSRDQVRNHLKITHYHQTDAKGEDAELKRALQSVFCDIFDIDSSSKVRKVNYEPDT